jgi:hypothetical protein
MHRRRRQRLRRDAHVVAAIAEGMAVARPIGEEQQGARRRGGLGQETQQLFRGGVNPVQVFDDEHERLLRGGAQEMRLQRTHRLTAAPDRIQGFGRRVAHMQGQQAADERQRPGERATEGSLAAFELRTRLRLVVAVVDAEESAHPVADGIEGGGVGVRAAVPLEPGVRLAGEALAKLVEQARLADSNAACKAASSGSRPTSGVRPVSAAASIRPLTGRSATTSKACTGVRLPLTDCFPASRTSKKPATACRVDSEIHTAPGGASACSRAARFVVSPTAV